MREFIRHPIDIPIKIIESEGEDCESEDSLDQSLHDISIGGLRCLSDKPLAAGTEITIIIDLVEPALEIPGIVIWCRSNDTSTAGASYELGIEYQGEKDVYRLRMVEQICHIEH
jgi:Tfp pilus assembly protein PilZ